MQVQIKENNIKKEIEILSIQKLPVPQSAKKVLEILCTDGPMTSGELETKCSYSDRTIRNALKKLIGIGLVKKVANFRDMRTSLFHVEPLSAA
jgi:predicted transcriptional regulator